MLLYRKFPFGIKNIGATFEKTASNTFHNIKYIADVYLDDFTA